MPYIEPKKIIFPIGLLFIGLLLLVGCGSNSNKTPKEQVDNQQRVELSKGVKVIAVQGNAVTPDRISIICVEGAAFLYVSREVAYAGNPALARFPEQDKSCPKGE